MEMAKIGDTLGDHEKDYLESSEKLLRLLNDVWMGVIDVKVLDPLIFPGSPILSATVTSLNLTPLHAICYSNLVKIDTFQRLIDLGVDIDAKTTQGFTPLHTAVQFAGESRFSTHIQAIEILLNRGANPNIKNRDGLTPLQLALYTNKLQVVEVFLKETNKLANTDEIDDSKRLQYLVKHFLRERNDLTVSDTNYSIILHFLVLQKDEEMFDYIVKNAQFDANAMNADGYTLLHVVAEFGAPRCIKTLIGAGADPNFLSKYTFLSPIFSAVKDNRIENIEALLDCGACLHIIEKDRNTEGSPLHFAISFQNFESVETLVKNGADVNDIIDHRSPLEIALATGNSKIVQFLLANGADIDRKDDLGKTMLEKFCTSENFEVVNRLLSHGAKINSGGDSTLHLAAKCGNASIVRLLLEHGADVNYKYKANLYKTPLDVCCQIGNLEIVKLLLSHGAKLNQGDVPTLHYAIFGKNPEIVRLLLEHGADVHVLCKFDLKSPVPRTAFEFLIINAGNNSNRRDIIEIMMEYSRADVNLANPVTGETPLHLACLSNSRECSSRKEQVIKFLLRYNANVNALDNSGLTPLDHVFHKNNINDHDGGFKTDLKAVVAFLVKMIVKKEWVVEKNLQLLQEKPLSEIYAKCMDEINCMKKNICKSLNFSYLSILTLNIDALSHALTNKDLLQVLDNGEYLKDFPIYADNLDERIWEAKCRYPIIELGAEVFNKYIKKNFYFEFVELCKYLNSEDLNNFLTASSVKLCEKRLFFSSRSKEVRSTMMQIIIARFDRKIKRI